jgi:hypothetical protein
MATPGVTLPGPDGSQAHPFPADVWWYGMEATNGPVYFDNGTVLLPSYNGQINTPISHSTSTTPISMLLRFQALEARVKALEAKVGIG